MEWYFGFKLDLVCNDKGEIVDFIFTPANVDDRFPPKQKKFHDKIFGKIFGEKDYIEKCQFDRLFVDGIHLITKVCKNMKKKAVDFMDKVILRKRATIKTVNDVLKNTCQIEHSRHRSFENFISNMIPGLITYSCLPKKTSIKITSMLPNNVIA